MVFGFHFLKTAMKYLRNDKIDYELYVGPRRPFSSSRLLQVISQKIVKSSDCVMLHRRRRSLLWRSCAAATYRRCFNVAASSLLRKSLLKLVPLQPLITRFFKFSQKRKKVPLLCKKQKQKREI